MPGRWMLLVAGVLGFLAAPAPVLAGAIDVATVRLALIPDDLGSPCDATQPDNCLAQFTLEFQWLDGLVPGALGPAPAPEISGGFTVDGSDFTFIPVSELSPTDVFSPTIGLPVLASARVSFEFQNQIITIEQAFLLTDLFDSDDTPSGGETLLFQHTYDDPVTVPESATLPSAALGLLGIGLFSLLTHRFAHA